MIRLLIILLLIVGCDEAGITTDSLTTGTAVTDTLYISHDTTIYVIDTVYIDSEDVYGCTIESACNFDSTATIFDNSCEYLTCAGCMDTLAFNYDVAATINSGCSYGVSGKIKDSQGNAIKDVAILLTYDLNDFMGREISGRNMPITTISFSVRVEDDVLLWIEDMCGDTMAVLVDNILGAGYHSVIWDATGVLEGNYKAHLITSEFNQTQNLLLALLSYSNLEMIDGVLIQTQQDTSYTHNYHAMTDIDGRFSIPLNCLSFGIEQIGVDEFGNPTDNWTIPYRAKLWIVHEGDAMFSTQPYVVDPVNGVYIEIAAPY